MGVGRVRAVDEQPSRIPWWFTSDLTVVIISVVIIVIGLWIGLQ